MASVDNEPVDPFSVLERSSSEEELVMVERVSGVFERQSSLESVELVIGRLTDNLALDVCGLLRVGDRMLHLFNGRLMFEISFSIEILGFNIAKATWVAGLNDNEVRWEVLIRLDHDDIAHLQTFPLIIHEVELGVNLRLF
jgi:hypothetical protein